MLDAFSFAAPYTGSKKEPDMSLIPQGATMPTIIIEAGWSSGERHARRREGSDRD